MEDAPPGSAPGPGEQDGEHRVGPASALEKPSSPTSHAAAVGSLYPSQLAVGLALGAVALVRDPGSSEV